MGIDHVLNVTLLLAVLATVAERVTELFKQPFQDRFKRAYGPGSRGYELYVALVALLAATVVAVTSQTDLLWILTHHEASTWYNFDANHDVSIVGLLLTALAIGFGSRTWHELSEQITALKKAREAVSLEPGDALEQKRTDVRELAAAAIEANREQWFAQYPDLRGVSVGRKEEDGIESNEIVVLFEVESKLESPDVTLPAQIVFGQHTFQTDVIEAGPVVTTEFRPPSTPLKLSALPVDLGNSVSRANSSAVGTLGVRVKRGDKPFVLTCFHVVCGEELRSQKAKDELAECRLDTNTDLRCLSPGTSDGGAVNTHGIGRIVDAQFKPQHGLDIALIELDDPDAKVNRSIHQLSNAPTGLRQLGERHVQHRIPVRLCGRTSRVQTGRVLARNATLRIRYQGGVRRFSGLIRLSKMANTGDSGAAVVDLESKVIGIVVASSFRFTYAMPITPLLNLLKVELDVPKVGADV